MLTFSKTHGCSHKCWLEDLKRDKEMEGINTASEKQEHREDRWKSEGEEDLRLHNHRGTESP